MKIGDIWVVEGRNFMEYNSKILLVNGSDNIIKERFKKNDIWINNNQIGKVMLYDNKTYFIKYMKEHELTSVINILFILRVEDGFNYKGKKEVKKKLKKMKDNKNNSLFKQDVTSLSRKKVKQTQLKIGNKQNGLF